MQIFDYHSFRGFDFEASGSWIRNAQWLKLCILILDYFAPNPFLFLSLFMFTFIFAFHSTGKNPYKKPDGVKVS